MTGARGHKHGSLTQQREQADNWRAGKCNGYGVLLPCRCQCGAVGIKPLRSYTMKAINEHVGWGTDGHGLKVLFCNKCREVFYRTPDAGKAIQAQRVFSKKHQCAN